MTTLVAEAPKQKTKTPTVMKALVYQGPGKKALEERPMPAISAPTDAIVKITKTTICGTDLHIFKGDVSAAGWRAAYACGTGVPWGACYLDFRRGSAWAACWWGYRRHS